MPSVSTQGLVDGKERTGKEYLIRFAKNLGELSHMSCKPNETYPEFQRINVQQYHDSISQLEDELEEVNALGEWGLRDRFRDSNREEQMKFSKAARKDLELRNRYDKVIKEVESWEPHTERLQEMKEGALEHLKYVREFDCRPEDWRETESTLYKPTLYATPEEWKEATVSALNHQITFYKTKLAEEIERTHNNNLFISDLISSLEGMKQ
ncbi:hypothetical protein Blue_097 [Bacillus phage Deep Blue]|uniref:Uncharacterized protein n=1 Tax=Bacillus phage Deep Blue TaxID=1792245 RepID=A0A140HLQ8_9CAUD|nr:hypothetical protein Blue_097 [Bacillus phage Deep Blue]AMO25920.1 hypothetical protein Blue_097 [Bacillus phage Deep Blue]